MHCMRKLTQEEKARLKAMFDAGAVVLTDESIDKESKLDLANDMFLLKLLLEKGCINESQTHEMESNQGADHADKGLSDKVLCERGLQGSEDGSDAGPRDPSLLH